MPTQTMTVGGMSCRDCEAQWERIVKICRQPQKSKHFNSQYYIHFERDRYNEVKCS